MSSFAQTRFLGLVFLPCGHRLSKNKLCLLLRDAHFASIFEVCAVVRRLFSGKKTTILSNMTQVRLDDVHEKSNLTRQAFSWLVEVWGQPQHKPRVLFRQKSSPCPSDEFQQPRWHRPNLDLRASGKESKRSGQVCLKSPIWRCRCPLMVLGFVPKSFFETNQSEQRASSQHFWSKFVV